MLGNVFSYSLDLNINFFTREIATNKSSLKELFEAFSKYGGTARNLLNKSPEQVEDEISIAINRCTNFRSLFPISTDLQEKTSHALITIDPKVDEAGVLQPRVYQGRISSPYILNLLLNSKDHEFANGAKDTFKTFIQAAFTRSAAGIIFESRGHSYLFNSLKSPLTIRPLSTVGQPVSVNLKHIESNRFFKDLSKDLNAKLYYQPLSPTVSGIDSSALEVDDEGVRTSVVCFQFTINESRPINPSFLLNPWTNGLRGVETTQWKLVFIVPLENEPKFQSQKWESEDDTWSGQSYRS